MFDVKKYWQCAYDVSNRQLPPPNIRVIPLPLEEGNGRI